MVFFDFPLLFLELNVTFISPSCPGAITSELRSAAVHPQPA